MVVPYAYSIQNRTIRVWYVPYAYGMKYAYGTEHRQGNLAIIIIIIIDILHLIGIADPSMILLCLPCSISMLLSISLCAEIHHSVKCRELRFPATRLIRRV